MNTRESDLQTQVEDLRVALQDWRRTREYSQATLERLAQITVQCAGMVESWQQIEQQRGVAALPAASGSEGRIDSDSGDRIRALERTIEREWKALREGEDDTAGQLRELQGAMAQLSRDLQSVVTELRTARRPAPAAPPAAFPLESVMRIHEEMRESETGASAGAALKPGATRALPAAEPGTALALSARIESLERAVSTAAAPPPPSGRGAWIAAAAVVLAALSGVAAFWTQQRVEARLRDADARVSQAQQDRDQATAATREDAARKVADAQQSAARAQIVGNVLAAPDLVRYWLTGGDANPRAYAQVLFSRSRGMVFSASRLPAPGPGKAYQLWLLTRSGPVSAGVIVPDGAGRVTLATDTPPSVPSRLAGALVTIESSGGAATPSSDTVLARVE